MQLTDYPEWACLSQKLSKREAEDPYLVLNELFDYAHLPEMRQLMWQWLKITVNGQYAEGLEWREKNSILLLYEHMEKLIEAAHLLHLAHQKKTAISEHLF